jgi:hypothetical protein
MIVFIPHPNNPLWGTWCEVDHPARIQPSAVRAIYQAHLEASFRAGFSSPFAVKVAVANTARILGLSKPTVRSLCHLSPPKRRHLAHVASACRRSSPNARTDRCEHCGQRRASFPSANDSPPRICADANASQRWLIHQ